MEFPTSSSSDFSSDSDAVADRYEIFGMKQIQKFPSIINLNVGGHLFVTRLSTLQRHPRSKLAYMFSGKDKLVTDPKGNFFIDRDGQHFGHVLNYLRHNDLPPAHLGEAVLQEAKYYGLKELASRLRSSPSMMMEHMVRENIREKLEHKGIRKALASIAKQQAVNQCSSESLVHLVVTKDEAKEFLQYSKKDRKKYSSRFQVFPSFLAAFGRYYKHLPSDHISVYITDASMNLVVTCLCHDLCKAGYKCRVKPESVDADSKTRLITNDRDEFLVVVNCYEFTFNWLESEQLL